MDRKQFERDRLGITEQIRGLEEQKDNLDNIWWGQKDLPDIIGTYWKELDGTDFVAYTLVTGMDNENGILRGFCFDISRMLSKNSINSLYVKGRSTLYRHAVLGEEIEPEEFWLAYREATRHFISEEGMLVYEAEAMEELKLKWIEQGFMDKDGRVLAPKDWQQQHTHEEGE